ncbi:hypothetical protein [Methyloligella solikamskensis]|uniref:Uncharacterized protein n=1 Tax=Methyloligella solikamskensis TaxID=1177756 RepID=A0ABW3JA98_9HYPH
MRGTSRARLKQLLLAAALIALTPQVASAQSILGGGSNSSAIDAPLGLQSGATTATPPSRPPSTNTLFGSPPRADSYRADDSSSSRRANADPAEDGDDSGKPVPVSFRAMLTEQGPPLKGGVIWRIFTPGTPAGGQELVSTHREAQPTAALAPGEYLVNAAYGLSNLTRKIQVSRGKSVEESFVLNTGGLKLSAELSDETEIGSNLRFDILSDEQDQFGRRRVILADVEPSRVIRLNAGGYHVVSTYGDCNATVRADVTVEPGKLTVATVKHAAATVTFKLVMESGGEALADTRWTIITPTGDIVKEGAGALPTHILAAGDYAVVARHNGLSYTRKFTVAAGNADQVEVAVADGPSSPEALRKIMTPEFPTGGDGEAFGFAGESSTPPASIGGFANPGALLHDTVP